ncbi:MAG: right-handed parallel beta-helix repeat-containing protein, partial [Myxococcales bacterium]|nr:right-handed parallel beta-helix repeat-containing protein [Myxococcales bacterium]
WAPALVQIAADDFGDVPPVCLEGRDVERFQRHLSRLVRVLRVEPVDDVVEVTVDRPLNLDVPAEANPRLIPVGVARNIALRDVSLVANCPEALAIANHTEAACTNAQVLDDNGVFFEWTWGALAERVAGQGFGKFTIVVQHSADAAVRDCSMHHPAAYGDGGQGYGVHLIRTGRTVVRGERVDVARHGVVVDFGSTDAQVLDCDLRNMNQALIDVHGEASYDTLIRGNVLAGSTLGVIVGGGGRDVHCNDGPRHHVEDNDIRDCALAAVSISDYTRGLFVRSNALDASGTLFTAAFGGGGALIERNMLGAAGVFAISLGSEGTGDVTVRRNVFTSACTPEQAVLAVLGAERPVLEDNVFCPE